MELQDGGLKTFQGDGSGWIAREATIRKMRSRVEVGPRSVQRVRAFVFGSGVISIISVIGIVHGILVGQEGFASLGIFYFSAFGFSLMATSYFCYARDLGAAAWFAPFWFLPHIMATVLTLFELQSGESASGGVMPNKHRKLSVNVSRERR